MQDRHLSAAQPEVQRRLAGSLQFARLGHGQSVTYRVESESGRYLLRVHDPQHTALEPAANLPQSIESECLWLAALARDTDLNVAQPVAGADGAFVFHTECPGQEQSYPCSLLSWVPGEVLLGRRTPEHARQLAQVLASLQEHAAHWARPPGFTRPILDCAWTRTALERLAGLVDEGLLEAEDLERLGEAYERLLAEVADYERDPASSGLIHADLHEGNYVEHAGRLAPIDFGRAGFGPWLYDLAECSMHLYPDRRGDLIDAYAALRGLPPGGERLLEGYVIRSSIESFGYHAADPAGRASTSRSIPGFVRNHVSRYLAGQPYLREV